MLPLFLLPGFLAKLSVTWNGEIRNGVASLPDVGTKLKWMSTDWKVGLSYGVAL